MPICDIGTIGTATNSADYTYSYWVDQYNSEVTVTSSSATTASVTDDKIWVRFCNGDQYTTVTNVTDLSSTWYDWTVTTISQTGRILTNNDVTAYTEGNWNTWVADEVKESKRSKHRERHGDVNVAARASQRQQQLEHQREVALQQERKRVRRTSLERSMLLLRDACNDDQIEQLEDEGSIIVVGKSGTRYKVTDKGTVANVHVLEKNDKVSHRLCAHPLYVPQGDVMLAQKLMLEHDEEGFVKLANRHLAYGY